MLFNCIHGLQDAPTSSPHPSDINLDAVAPARANAQAIDADILVFEGDLELPFQDNIYDFITIHPVPTKNSIGK
jgi:methylase of polypeptide subunit release factors